MNDRDFFPLVENSDSGNAMNNFGCFPLLVKQKQSSTFDQDFTPKSNDRLSFDKIIFSNAQDENYDSTSALFQVTATFHDEDDNVNNLLNRKNVRTNSEAIQSHLLLRRCITAMECNRLSTFHIWDVRLISSYYNIQNWDEGRSTMYRNNVTTPYNFLSQEFILELQECIDRFFANQDMNGKTILACRHTTDPFFKHVKQLLLGCFFIWFDVPNTFR